MNVKEWFAVVLVVVMSAGFGVALHQALFDWDVASVSVEHPPNAGHQPLVRFSVPAGPGE